jgi:TorA maturation chaperone TorD
VELEFMAYLCGKTLEALKVGEGEKEEQLFGIQKQFLDEHLCAWVPKLTKDILETSSVDFYRGLAYATEGFLRLDRDSLERSTEELGR